MPTATGFRGGRAVVSGNLMEPVRCQGPNKLLACNGKFRPNQRVTQLYDRSLSASGSARAQNRRHQLAVAVIDGNGVVDGVAEAGFAVERDRCGAGKVAVTEQIGIGGVARRKDYKPGHHVKTGLERRQAAVFVDVDYEVVLEQGLGLHIKGQQADIGNPYREVRPLDEPAHVGRDGQHRLVEIEVRQTVAVEPMLEQVFHALAPGAIGGGDGHGRL